jgi:hypothetical protein
MYHHFRNSRWKPVEKNPAQITTAKKSAATKAAKLAAYADLRDAGEPGSPDTDKLRAANLANLFYDQLSISMKAELEE